MNQKGNILIFMLVPIGLVLVLGAGIGARYYTETVKTTPNQIGLSTEEIQQPIVEVSGIKLDEQSESQSIDKVLETELSEIESIVQHGNQLKTETETYVGLVSIPEIEDLSLLDSSVQTPVKIILPSIQSDKITSAGCVLDGDCYRCKNNWGACYSAQDCIDTCPNFPSSTISPECKTIINNGPTDNKINIYFYEEGFNTKMQAYNDYVAEVTSVIFGGSFGIESFPGIEPFKSLKQEFNVFSYEDKKNSEEILLNHHSQISKNLKENCQGFVAPSAWGHADGNYNIIVVPHDEIGRWSSGSMDHEILNSTTVRIASADIIYQNMDIPAVLAHELGHKIGFFDEEYAYYDLYLGANTIYPNIDSFSCTKWCKGVDKQSECYTKYTKWLDCFKDKFISSSSNIQKVLSDNKLNWNIFGDYSWWGTCFDSKNMHICGNKIAYELDSQIRPQVYGLSELNKEWADNWDYCKGLDIDLAGSNACDLGLDCGENGCFAAASMSRFLPSQEDKSLMGIMITSTNIFNKLDEDILRSNILNKTRYIDVEIIDWK